MRVPGFFGGALADGADITAIWDETHSDDGIVYRCYLRKGTKIEVSSGMSRFELQKKYEDWIND